MSGNQKMFFQRANNSFSKKAIHIELHPAPNQTKYIYLFPWHWHDYYELEIFLSGNGVERLNDRTLSLQRGSIVLLTPNGCHELEIDDTANIFNIQFSGIGISESILKRLHGLTGCNYRLSDAEFNDVLAILEIMQKDYENDRQAELQLMLEWLLLVLLRETEKQSDAPDYDEKIIEIINYIHHHFMEKISVGIIAKKFGYSATYMGAMFKNKIGVSISTYLKNIRLNYAYSMLIGTDMTIEQISEQAGFCDRTYFSAQFKEKYKLSPAECRLAHNK